LVVRRGRQHLNTFCFESAALWLALRAGRRAGATDTEYHRIRRHDAVVDAVLLAALDADLIACREVAKQFECPYVTGASITPDGVIVMADGTVLALDVVWRRGLAGRL
jgi:hypothetical protein